MSAQTIITQQASVANDGFFCFFSDATNCFYNPANPPIYFSLGDLIAVMALVVAVKQILAFDSKIVLGLQKKWKKILLNFFLCFGVIFVLLSSVIPQIDPLIRMQILKYNFLNYPLLYEIIATILFVLYPFFLIKFSKKQKKLCRDDNMGDFFQVLMENLSNNSRDVNVVVDILSINLGGVLEKIDKTVGYLEVVMSDNRFINQVITSRFDFLFVFFEEIKQKRVDSKKIELILKKIFVSLYENKNSFLYKQQPCEDGFALLSNNIFNILFFDQNFLHDYDPLNYWEGGFSQSRRIDSLQKTFDIKSVEVYIQCIKKAMDGYWSDNGKINSSMIGAAIKRVAYYCAGYFYNSRDNAKEACDKAQGLLWFISWDIPINLGLAFSNNKISGGDASFIDGYTEAVYAIEEGMSYFEEKEKDELFSLQDFLSKIFDFEKHESDELKKISSKVEELIYKQAEENISNGYWPPVLKIYIYQIVGNPLLLKAGDRLIKFMYEKLEPAILDAKRMAGESGKKIEKVLLPKSVIYNRDEKVFYKVLYRGSLQKIPRPS